MRSSVDASGQTERNDVTKRALRESAAHDNSELFAELVRENKRAVYALAYAKLRNAHDAEDVMQEVFIEAYRNFRKIRDPNNIGGWLRKATIFRCKDHFRKNVRRERREQRFAETSPANPLTNTTPVAGTANGVVEAIELLPEKYRRILMLKHFAGLSYTEISALTGLSNTTICGRLQAARKNLREKLAEIVQGVDRK